MNFQTDYIVPTQLCVYLATQDPAEEAGYLGLAREVGPWPSSRRHEAFAFAEETIGHDVNDYDSDPRFDGEPLFYSFYDLGDLEPQYRRITGASLEEFDEDGTIWEWHKRNGRWQPEAMRNQPRTISDTRHWRPYDRA